MDEALLDEELAVVVSELSHAKKNGELTKDLDSGKKPGRVLLAQELLEVAHADLQLA